MIWYTELLPVSTMRFGLLGLGDQSCILFKGLTTEYCQTASPHPTSISPVVSRFFWPPADAAQHGPADEGVGNVVQAQHAQHVFCNHAESLALRRLTLQMPNEPCMSTCAASPLHDPC